MNVIDAIVGLTSMANEQNMGETPQASDEEITKQFLLQNKVSEHCANELIQYRGFTSLYALALAEPEDIQGPEIPPGQQRLIRHLVKVLKSQSESKTLDQAAVSNAQPTLPNTDSGLCTSQTTQPPTTQQPASRQHTAHPHQAGASAIQQPDDLYGSAILNSMIAEQQHLRDSSSAPAFNSTAHASRQSDSVSQPTWNDPQIHIATATGKSVTGYYDICDFAQCSIEEETIIGGQGDQQIVVKSGPRKPKLENLTLSQWSIANLAIIYKLVGENKLGGGSMLDYLSYTTKVYQLVQRFSLPSVLLYDQEYRKLQASMNFWWGTDVQHLHTLCLQARDKPVMHGAQNSKKPGMQKPGGNRSDRSKRDTPICRNFNSTKGCSHPNCNYRHECIVPGCGKAHTVMTHTTEKK